MDRDCYLNSSELQHMTDTLLFIANENSKHYDNRNFDNSSYKNNENDYSKALAALEKRLDEKTGLSQEEFLVWGVEDNSLVEPMLELLFQVCHVSFVLRPYCRHHEHDIGEYNIIFNFYDCDVDLYVEIK